MTYSQQLGAVASSASGTKIVLGTPCDNPDGGLGVSVLDITANALTTGVFGSCNVVVSSDGQRITATLAWRTCAPTPWRTSAGCATPMRDQGFLKQYFRRAVRSSGALLFAPEVANHGNPQVPAVAIFDTHTGDLRQRVELPQNLVIGYALALDDTGSMMFTVSTTGIMVTQLSHVPLAAKNVIPAAASAGSTVQVRGSGFQNGATVTFGATQASATFVDANTLSVIVPAMASGSQRVNMKNPNGEQYALDGGFTVN